MGDYLGAYDVSRQSVVIQGNRITGFQEGTFLDIERASDGWHKHVGSNGDVVRSKDLDRTGSYTLTLMAQHPDNDTLQQIADEDEAFSTGFGTFQVLDLSGDPTNPPECHSQVAWIRKRPKYERAKQAGPVVWVFDAADLEINHTGNLIPAST